MKLSYVHANLNALVPSNGVAVSVPKHFLDSDVKLVTDAIMGKVKPTTTPKPTTTTTTAPPPITPECLVVGDLYNFGKDEDAYDLEAELLDAVGYDVFGASPGSKLGLWLYGYTKRTSPSSALLKLRSNYTHFKKDLDDMEYIETNDPLTTRSAIYAINELRDNNNRINCLVFLSAVKDTKDLPQINPQHLQLKRIVAVGLDNANLNALVPNGIAVSVPKHFLDSHVKIITDAIIGKPKPTTTTTTTRPVTTTAPIKPYDCLIVGDLYNFGHNFDFYDIEADLIDAIGYDLFDVAPGSSLGLWAYGYSNYSTDPNTSLDKIRKNYNDFKSDVGKFNHYAMDDNVVSTKKAIDALNAMRNNGKRINCLVFLSGTRIADELPQLNPKNLKLDRIVAVGLNSQILDPLVAGRGIAVSVPEYFFDSHVKLVIDAIMGRVPPVTTTKPATTTTAPPKPMDCLLVGDLYNFGHNFEFYEIEADLIDAIGYDLFDLAPGSSLGLWAYGYSNYSTEPTTSLEKIRKTYNEFKADLHKFQHYVWDDYVVSTKKAIDALNAMRDNGKRINCLVFLSGTRIADEMPQLNPRQLKLERIVAVGLNSQILDPLVAGHGISVSVPEDFLDFHVKMVIDAIMGRIPPVTTTKPATTTTLPPTPVDCLLVGDLYNFNKDEEAYETEADLINAVAYDIFDTSPRSSLGLWAYGYTSFDKNPDTSLGKIRKNYDDFKADLADFEYKDIASPLTTKTAIDAINAMRDNSNRIKCLVFLSATKDTKGMPVIDPQHLNLERIVAVGLNNTNLDALVPYNRGISVRVPENFLDVHVKHVIDAMMGRVGPVTTRKPTTPTPPPITPHCLFVADFLNFGENVDDYDLEAALMGDVGYDLFDFDSKTSLGLWAFGHTDYSEEPSKSLEKMRNKYGDFEKDINAMEYVKKQNPMKTSKAIEAINAMRDNGNRINCLVFFSAIKDTKGLPQINPQHLNLERIVAVGLNETDLDDLVPANGAVLSIPYNFIDVDVKLITDTIFGRHKPTRKPTTIAPSTRPLSTTKRQPSNRRDCIVVADFISFGRDEDTYEQEINFISDLSYDFFALSNRTSMGLWVYGYTNFTNSSVNATLDNMKANFSEFSLELDRVEYFRIANPVTTRDAIEQINKLHVTNERANCMVFISGVTDTAGLPRINPDMPIDRFVAVGFNNTDLRRIIPNTPVAKAVPVPIHFLEQHVTSVLQEII
ncbi:hypothetical protein ANCCAN_01922 [Ancylostoma caninum]|uniref:Uncharacterized protein n=1 Tax=Ancylostoma caninum TaxID=29170 RepID=A0A368H5I9_ANCCA|nr:hypothetical protein ANCCAN_01922 [Ancylostoma caninum]